MYNYKDFVVASRRRKSVSFLQSLEEIPMRVSLLIIIFFLSALIIVQFALKPDTTALSLATLVGSLTAFLKLIEPHLAQ